jgi:hypothetical protein
MRPPPDICPQCGTEVPPRARACPECGADEATGWSEHANAQRLDLPDDEFNYDDFVQREFGQTRAPARPPIGWLWWCVAVVLLVLALIGWLGF